MRRDKHGLVLAGSAQAQPKGVAMPLKKQAP
jgi:hypothetical protein